MKAMLLKIAVCTLMFTGCSMNEVFENESKTNAIQFSNLNGKLTKALGANDKLSDYQVYSAWSVASNAWYINATVNGVSNGYSPQKYWPGNGTVSFYSYAPAGSSCFNVSASTGTTSVNGAYTVASEAQEDFTIATPVINQSSGGVNLMFNHMLTKITMNVVLDDNGTLDGYEITRKSGLLTLDYQKANFDVMTGSQGAYDSKGEYTYAMTANSAHTNDGAYLNVLPQPQDNEGKVQLSVEIKDKATGEIFIPMTKLYVFNLKDILSAAKGQLEAGKWYKFTFCIQDISTDENGNPLFNKVTFSTSNADWIGAPSRPLQP